MNMSRETMIKSIPGIIERFDFEKVRAFMIINKWTWRGESDPPTIEQLKSTAMSLLFNVTDQKEDAGNAGTGGFTAYKLPWGLALHFNLEYKASY